MTVCSRPRPSGGVGQPDGVTRASKEERFVEPAVFDLLPGESLLWEGSPTRHRLLRRTDAFVIPFSVVLCAVIVGFAVAALSSGAPAIIALWVGMFVLIGLYLVAGRFVLRALASRRTRYAVTDRRVIATGGVTGRRIRSEYLASLPSPVVTEEPDGSGTLTFGGVPDVATLFRRSNGFTAWFAEPPGPPTLWDIPHIRHVRDLVASYQSPSPSR
jgi:multisubunit Na+/H+ antiporter MnhC subunit